MVLSVITTKENDYSEGSLLVSSFHKIGLSTDESSKLRLLLASKSPRRREILDMMGLVGRYTVKPSPLNEEELQIELANKNFSPQEYARTLAERKAHAMGVLMGTAMPNSGEVTIIIGSDTIVDLDGTIMEKPKNEGDAFNMLRRLSGNVHQVHSGVAAYAVGAGLQNNEKLMFSFTDTARVKFATLTDDDIMAYIDTNEPFDKAGSYGIQGVGGQFGEYVWIVVLLITSANNASYSSSAVERMEGDFFTVMGLPMHRLSKELSLAIRSLSI
ncbi:hypothetical protein ACHAWU_005492 [Discostella pseudostelligera]|uniref:Uncharacterized protein n=1 Tax=Discostella pseudostelligera TaxID=259834 RepID=A0ABD3MVP8_9STRA